MPEGETGRHANAEDSARQAGHRHPDGAQDNSSHRALRTMSTDRETPATTRAMPTTTAAL